MQLIQFSSLILTIFTLLSCNSQKGTSKTQDNPEQKTIHLSGTYIISLIGTNKDLPDNLTITFNEANNKVSGFTGCNRFIGNYFTDTATIKFSELASTKMYCKEIMNIEEQLLKALAEVNSFSITDNQMSLRKNNAILIKASKEISNKKQAKENYTIEYSAKSRGLDRLININYKNISIVDAIDQSPFIKPCSENNWENIVKALNSIDIKNISNLKAPSEKRLFDGAAIANLTIIHNGRTYKTKAFDHGNPPKPIAELVKVILSISENID
ncbi:MAG: META domain-containing protein [Algibacter sp.]|uniref:META domain-containing protein n=1 Tax=Algibacter sp. TaxID=1872428 RepID=UPI003296D3E0